MGSLIVGKEGTGERNISGNKSVILSYVGLFVPGPVPKRPDQ